MVLLFVLRKFKTYIRTIVWWNGGEFVFQSEIWFLKTWPLEETLLTSSLEPVLNFTKIIAWKGLCVSCNFCSLVTVLGLERQTWAVLQAGRLGALLGLGTAWQWSSAPVEQRVALLPSCPSLHMG